MRNIQIYPSPITHESRIERMTAALADAGVFDEILIVGTQPGGLPAEQVWDSRRRILRIPRLAERGTSLIAKLLKTRSWTARVMRRLSAERNVGCITCHSLAVLPLAARLAHKFGARLSYEPHELETETAHSHGIRRYLMQRLEAKWIRQADATTVVSSEIARWYQARYALKRVVVVRNIPAAVSSTEAVNLRARYNIAADHRIFVYSGGLFPGRRVEQFVRLFAALPSDRHVLFMGFGPLSELVQGALRRHANIHYLPAVPSREVIPHLRGADVGLSGVENRSLSYFYSLPNKQFEYLHAGLGSIVPNYPEMSRLIAATGAGWVTRDDSDEAWGEAIMAIDEAAIALARERALAAAAHYTHAREVEALLVLYRELGFPCGRQRSAENFVAYGDVTRRK